MQESLHNTGENTMPPPKIKPGQFLRCTASGYGRDDPYYKHEGFIIFLKKVPPSVQEREIVVKVMAIKDRYGFADFVEVAE